LLVLVGAGLRRSQLTKEAEEVISGADVVLVDTYTMPAARWLLEAARELNPAAKEATRTDLEDNSANIIDLAKTLDVVIIVPGDPLIATTHSSLVVEGKRKGVEVKVVSGVSGVCSMESLLGLHFYKFGRTVTLPGPWRGVSADEAAIELLGNLCRGLHTILLLDVSPEGNSLKPSEGLRELRESLVKLLQEGQLSLISKLLVLLVSIDDQVHVKRLRLDAPLRDYEVPVGSLVVPGRLHVSEREFLQYVYSIPDSELRAHNETLAMMDTCGLYFKALSQLRSS